MAKTYIVTITQSVDGMHIYTQCCSYMILVSKQALRHMRNKRRKKKKIQSGIHHDCRYFVAYIIHINRSDRAIYGRRRSRRKLLRLRRRNSPHVIFSASYPPCRINTSLKILILHIGSSATLYPTVTFPIASLCRQCCPSSRNKLVSDNAPKLPVPFPHFPIVLFY